MFTNARQSVLSSYTLPQIADHCAVVAHLLAKKSRPPKPYRRKIFMYDKADARQLWDGLEAIDWDSILQGSLEEAVLSWTGNFLATCHAHVPLKLITINPSSKPWYNNCLKSLATGRYRLCHHSRCQPPDATVVSAFRKVRNLYVSELRAVERRYFSRLDQKLISGSLPAKVWWRYAKRVCGWSSRTGIQTLSVDGQVVTSPNQQVAMREREVYKAMLCFSPSFPLRLIASADSKTDGANCVETWIIENVNWSQNRLGILPSSLWKVFLRFFLQMKVFLTDEPNTNEKKAATKHPFTALLSREEKNKDAFSAIFSFECPFSTPI